MNLALKELISMGEDTCIRYRMYGKNNILKWTVDLYYYAFTCTSDSVCI